MNIKRYFAIIALIYAGILGSTYATGCMGVDRVEALVAERESALSAIDVLTNEFSGLKADLEAISADDPDAAAMADKLLALMDEKSAEALKWTRIVKESAEKLSKAEDGWAWAETIAGIATGFFPPLAVAVPMIRRGRNMFNGVVGAMAAGGGPRDAKRAREFMNTVPGLKDRVTAQRVEIGDKEMQAVKTAA